MNRKLLIVSQHFPPEIGAASNRMEHLCRYLSKAGYELYVITSQPSYPNRTLYTKQAFFSNENGCRLYRIPIISIGNNGVLSRISQHLAFLLMASMVTIILGIQYQIKTCITTSPPFSVNMIGLLFKLTGWRRKWIMEVRDLWPDSMTAVEFIEKNALIYRWLKRLELYFYRTASNIVVVTNQTKRILEQQEIPANKIKIITNGIPDWTAEVFNLKLSSQRINSEFIILYAGNIGKSQNLAQLIQAAEYLSDYKFCIIGDGLEKEKLMKLVERKNLKNITFIDAITDKRLLLNWYAKADIGVISLKDAKLFENVIPSKLFEYAGARLPILFIGKGEGAELVNKYKLGKVALSKTEDIIDAINCMYDDIQSYRENSDNLDKFIQKYRWSSLANKYIKLIDSHL
ncbi:glycosyltransferase family 4 protein [Insulibacter thermoxylanivorax]